MKYDVAIIGAGPAGLTAAISSAMAKASVAVIESNSIVAKKLLLTSKKHCILTHNDTPHEFLRAYGKYAPFLKKPLYEFGPEKVRQFFDSHGLTTKVEKNGCIYPISNRAADVSRVMLDTARRQNTRFCVANKVTQITKQNQNFLIKGTQQQIEAKCVIIATGGKSWPQTGSTGDGYKFAQLFGHSIKHPKPILVPLITAGSWLHELASTNLNDVILTAKIKNKKIALRGPLTFTENGIAGPVTLDLSRYLTDFINQPDALTQLYLDLMPETTAPQLNTRIIQLCDKYPHREIAGLISTMLTRKLALKVCQQLHDNRPVIAEKLTSQNRNAIINLIKKLAITATGTKTLNEAQVTRGGIPLTEIDSKSMQSLICPGLFFAGEVIDADGPCGGFNRQICFSTGAVAGAYAAAIAANNTSIKELKQKTNYKFINHHK